MNHLERALDKQNQWWKYLVVFLTGFLASNLIGVIPLIIVIAVKTMHRGGMMSSPPNNAMDLSVYGIGQNLGLILMMIPFLVGLISVVILLKPMHKRSLQEVINGTRKIRWNRYFYAMTIWGIILGVYLAIDYSINPANYVVRFNLHSLVPLILISFLLIPFQTAFEEVLFRGYLMQGIGAWTRNRWIALFIPAILFGLMHSFNPEVKEYGFWMVMPQYILFGLVFGLVTILDDGLEMALGAHTANNIFLAILVTNKSSVLQTAALLEQQKVNPAKETLFLLFFSIIFITFLVYKFRWNLRILNIRIEKKIPIESAIVE